jgi:hypothetical protein
MGARTTVLYGQTHGAMIAPDLSGRTGSASGNVTAIDPAIGAVIGDPRPSPALDNCTLPSPAAPAAPRTYISMTRRNVGDLLNERHTVRRRDRGLTVRVVRLQRGSSSRASADPECRHRKPVELGWPARLTGLFR